MLVFEKGKKYKFDKEKFIEIYGEEFYNESYNLWISKIEDIVFTPQATHISGKYEFSEDECEANYEVICQWCSEVE